MYKKILVPLDGSNEAEHALPHAKTIALGCDPTAKLILFYITEQMLPSLDSYESTQLSIEREEKLELATRQYLEILANHYEQSGVEIEALVIKSTTGDIADEILRYVEESGVDLIVMSTHGRSGMSRWAFGSITDRVITHSKSPVLVISPPGYRSSC